LRIFSRYRVQLGNACREALLQQDAEIVKQSLINTRYQVELGNEPKIKAAVFTQEVK